MTDGTRRRSRITRLKDGVEFYPSQLAAIRRAQHAINLETYEFLEGQIADEMLAALTERAAAGVEVRIIVDALGSFATRDAYFDGLRAAGGQMCWYHRVHHFDHRSFALNDEVNLAVLDPALVATIEADFFDDLAQSQQLNLSLLEQQTLLAQGESLFDNVLERKAEPAGNIRSENTCASWREPQIFRLRFAPLGMTKLRVNLGWKLRWTGAPCRRQPTWAEHNGAKRHRMISLSLK